MFVKALWRRILFALSSRAMMDTAADILPWMCTASIAGAVLMVANRATIADWKSQTIALFVAAAVSFVVGVWMKARGGKSP